MLISDGSLLSRALVTKPGLEMDSDSLSDVRVVVGEIANTWPDETIGILKSRNAGLLEMLDRVEGRVVSMLYLTNMPPAIKKEFKKTLAEYKKVGQMCEMYVKRHIAAK